jgi:NADH-quinone oxidoreductase subunit H
MFPLLFFLFFLLGYALAAVYVERKVSAFVQDRLGPMETGRYGAAQTLADVIKLLQKEDIAPALADRWLFLSAPYVIFAAILTAFAFVPLSAGVQASGAQTGIFALLAVVSVDVLGLLMAGWGANNKYALYGAVRSVAQLVSYEVPLGLSVVCVTVVCASLNLQEISYQQGIWWQPGPGQANYLFGLRALGLDVTTVGGLLTWNVVRCPPLLAVFVIFFIATLAECNRAPFDLPEAESELVAGYQTEYSGMRWALLMVSEYGLMLLVSLLAAILFFGGWNTPLPNLGPVRLAEWTGGTPGTWGGHVLGAGWLLAKALLLVGVQMWVRWTYPRLRLDQLMTLGWKYLTPFALALLLLCAGWRLLA